MQLASWSLVEKPPNHLKVCTFTLLSASQVCTPLPTHLGPSLTFFQKSGGTKDFISKKEWIEREKNEWENRRAIHTHTCMPAPTNNY